MPPNEATFPSSASFSICDVEDGNVTLVMAIAEPKCALLSLNFTIAFESTFQTLDFRYRIEPPMAATLEAKEVFHLPLTVTATNTTNTEKQNLESKHT